MVHVVKVKKKKSCGLFRQGLHHCASAAKYESDERKNMSVDILCSRQSAWRLMKSNKYCRVIYSGS